MPADGTNAAFAHGDFGASWLAVLVTIYPGFPDLARPIVEVATI
jgi:hypothetical protein